MVALAETREPYVTPLRVLIAEDSEDDALLVLRELKRGGYEPKYERVETPEAMNEALTNSEWDVVISDYHLPRFGGLEALKMWRETVSEAPFIVVSGKVGEDVAVEMMKTGAYDYVMKDNLGRLCATVKRGLEEARERRERKRVERELRRRDAILEAVRFAAERLLGEAVGWEESVRAILRRLGEATETSRVYIFENFVGEDGEVWATMRHEWVARGVSVQMDNPLMEAMPYRAAGYGRWVEVLSRGEPVYGHTRELPGSEQPELRNQDILSIVVVPIFVEGRWWGFIGFDECVREREWSTAEIGALGAAAGTLGAAIRRRRIEEELRQSEERYRAVIEQATDGIYLLDVDTKRLLETNPSLQKILGYTADELRGMEVYDFVAHPRENIDSVIQRALSERRRFVGERKYRRKNGSLIDVEVGVSVILLGDKEVICTIVRDITERKRAEEALARSENRLRTIIETEPECVKVLGMDGSLLEMNPAGLSMIEADSLEQVRGKPVYEYIVPEHRSDFVALTERVLHGGSGTLEFEFVGLKGTSRWLETHAVPLRDARGEIAGLLAITRDITERKKNEEALRESEERFKGLAEASFEGIAITQDGKIIETNAAFATMFGYEPSEVIGMTPLDVTAPESREVVRNSRSSGFEEPYEAVSLRKDGTTFDTEIRGKMSSYKGHSVRVSAIRDITERKKNEEALRQSERRYRAVIEQATENIFLVDVETKRIVESNPAFQKTLGYAEEELRGMTLYDIVAADRENIDANVRRVLEQNNPFVGVRKYRRKDGSLVDVEVSASTILRDGRETLCAVAHDVTERVRAQRLLEERVATLSRIAADLVLERPIEESLAILAKSVLNASTAVACSVSLIDEATGLLRIEGSHGLPEGFKAGIEAVWQNGSVRSSTLEALHTRRPTLSSHHRQRMLEDPLYAPVHHLLREVTWDTVFIVPLVSRGRTLGAIHFSYLEGQQPGEDERVFLEAIADQAAVAVENVRLFAEARGKAALEERQRLARELHDSVSQALYGISLGAKTARTLLERAPNQAADPLDYVLSLSEAGLAEMRALIFELRPESLEKEGLAAALDKQTAALRARHEIEVEATLCDEPEASPEAKETVYRIVQEALHNTVKHARASNVEITMECDSQNLFVEVSDDGGGFDAQGDFPGHLGLRSMRERASRLGGTLEVDSAPGKGTRIRTRIPV